MNKGSIKLDNNIAIIFISIILFFCYIYIYDKYNNIYNKLEILSKENNIIKEKLNNKNTNLNIIENNDIISKKLNQIIENRHQNLENGHQNLENMPQNLENRIPNNSDRDYRALIDPLYPPLKRNYNFSEQEINRMPINIETRPSGGDYQQIGMLHKETNINTDLESPGSNTDSHILALYGKPIYKGSSNWLYYTTSSSNIKIPIKINNKDCTDDNGCKEIYDGDIINIDELNGNFKVKIYKFDKPRYIPYV